MEEEGKPEGGPPLTKDAQTKLEKLYYQRELRGLELKAYSGVLEALRASGKPNTEKESIIKTLRDYFKVSEDRHKAEVRVLAHDEKLCLISEKVTGYNFSEEWAYQAQRIYVPLSNPLFSVFRSFPPSLSRKGVRTLRDPTPVGKDKTTLCDDDDFEGFSESELETIESLISDHPACNGWPAERQKPLTLAVELGTGNEDEVEEVEKLLKKKLKAKKHQKFEHAKSPDITVAHRTSGRSSSFNNSENKSSSTAKGRGVKRKDSEDISPPNSVEAAPSAKIRQKVLKHNRVQIKGKVSSRRPSTPPVENKKIKESSEETSSADEGENGPLPLDESSRVMSPVFSEVIRASVLSRSKGSAARLERRKNISLNSPGKIKTGKVRPRTPNQKTGKFKNSVPTSGSRRKSKLNEKLDYDDVLMDLDGNEMDKQYVSPPDDVPRRLLLDSQSFDRREFKSTEDCAVYAESLPINYNHEDMEQVTDGVFKRPLPPSRGPKHWELKDARLSHRVESISDENNSNTVHYAEIDGGHHQQHNLSSDPSSMQANNISDPMAPSTPTKSEITPPSKKQRIKSPLIVNPNYNPPSPKVPLPPPVFNSSLSSVNSKKRLNNKPISVVDSLNLHLPTTATASSLAASSNNKRAGTVGGGGCSMFSNSSALIAGARGTAPGILQQQRKAQPHILANSKAHQRAFSPAAANTSSSVSNNVNSNAHLPVTGTPTLSTTSIPATSPVLAGTAATHTVQIPTSPIPISAISSVPSSPTPLPFQSFPTSNASSISIGTTSVPIGRATTGPNIIFVQKSNGPGTSGGGSVPNNVIPLKTSPRAVILRRTQLPRQANVMILDMQKNQIVTPGQAPPFLQTARILNAPGEMSIVDYIQSQSNAGPLKSPTSTLVNSVPLTPTDTSSVQTVISPTQLQKQEGIVIQTTNAESFLANFSATAQINHQHISNPLPVVSASSIEPNSVVETTDKENNDIGNEEASSPQDAPQDAEYAQIEAELMQMEEGSFEEVVYEEEVTTEIVPLEDGGNTQYIYTNDTCASAEGEVASASQEASSHNASSASAGGSSTDTASEAETSINNAESPEILIKNVSHGPIDEIKVASDVITRALSLSDTSSTKRLTFTAPLTVEPTAFNISSQNLPDSITVSVNSTEATVIPTVFQTGADLHSTPVVMGDTTSTNDVHGEVVGPTIEVALHTSEVLQPSEPQVQETSNAS